MYKALEFVPHSKEQLDYCMSTTRFNVPCCGRRWGKSQAAGRRMTKKLLVPDTYNWIVGPTYKLGEKEFRVVYQDFEKLGLLKHCRKAYSPKQGDMRIKTPWNSVLEVVSAEKADSLLGEGLDHVIMSEAATHTRAVWEQYIEPALSDKLGSADFPSTPRGFNWYQGLWELGQDPSEPMYKSWRLPTWLNSVRYPGGINNPEINRIRANVSKHYFDQEYGASFTSFSGQIYDDFDEQLHVQPHTFNPEWENFLAMDFGFANPFVALDIQVDPGNDSVHVWREYYARYMSTYDHGITLKNRENPPGYHVDAMYGDPRGADEIAILNNVLGYVAGPVVPWKHGVEAIKRLMKISATPPFKPHFFIDPACMNTIRSIGQLHVKELSASSHLDLNEFNASGTTNIQHKVDDHAADAVRYFVGPHYVLGAGSHLSEVYGGQYEGSEAQDFLTVRKSVTVGGDINMSMEF